MTKETDGSMRDLVIIAAMLGVGFVAYNIIMAITYKWTERKYAPLLHFMDKELIPSLERYNECDYTRGYRVRIRRVASTSSGAVFVTIDYNDSMYEVYVNNSADYLGIENHLNSSKEIEYKFSRVAPLRPRCERILELALDEDKIARDTSFLEAVTSDYNISKEMKD